MAASTVTVDYENLKVVLDELWQVMGEMMPDHMREAYNDLRTMQNGASRIASGNYNPGA